MLEEEEFRMSERQRPTLLAYLHRLGRDTALDSGDAPLLERFVHERDEAAFTSLMRRHGPLVWSVCRRVLAEEHAAEDAFQATFLVLVRKARSVSKQTSIRSWLYGVALRIALRARQREGLRRGRERSSPPREAGDTPDEADWEDMRPILDEEIQRLPEKYRLPVILCYLEGQTNDEAARQLNCPRGTIATRLARARERLRSRLVRRGLTLSAGGLAAMLSENVLSAAVSPLVISLAVKVVLSGSAPVSITALTEGVLHAMFVTKVKTILIVGLALSAIGGAGVYTYNLHGQTPVAESPPKSPEKAVPGKIAPAKSPEALRKLLQERRDMAEQELKTLFEFYKIGAGNVTTDLLLGSSKRLLKSELELSEKKEARLAAHARHLKLATTFAERSKAMHKTGRIAPAGLSLAEYERLDAEIELEREKAR
jgi:RNA polymerase sigma factor (sigma-70 family)